MATPARPERAPKSESRPAGPKIVRLAPRSLRGTVKLVSDRQLSLSLSDPGNRADRMIQAYRLSIDVAKAVNRIAQDISGLKPRLTRGGPDGDVVTSGPAWAMFQAPNPRWSPGMLWHTFTRYLMVTGRSYLLMDGAIGRNEPPRLAGTPRRLWCLKADTITPIPAPPAGIAGYRWKEGEEEADLPPEWVAECSFPDLAAPYAAGMSPLRPALMAIEQAINLSRHNLNFLRRGATPSVIVTPEEELDDEERRAFERQVAEGWVGPDNAGGVLIAYGMKVEPFQVNHRDMQYQALKRDTAHDIYGAVGTQPAMAGDFGDSTGLGAGAQVDMQLRSHWQNTIKPIAGLIEYMVTQQILPAVEPGLHFSFDWDAVEDLQESEDAKLERNIKRYRHGLVTANELLEEEGKEGYGPAGDIHWIDSSLTPAELAAEPPEPPPPPPPPGAPPGQPGTAAPVDEAPGTEGGPPEAEGPTEVEDQLRSMRRAAREVVRRATWQRYEMHRIRAERELEGAWRRELRWLENVIIARVKAAPPGSTALEGRRDEGDELPYDPEFYLPGEAELEGRVAASTGPLYRTIVARFGQDILDQVRRGARFDIENPAVVDMLEKRAGKVGLECARLLEQLKPVLREGLKAGETTEDLVKKIRAAVAGSPLTPVRGGPSVRSLRIARTESGGASNAARTEGYRQGGVERHEWVSSRDDLVRDQHNAEEGVDGEVVEVGAMFSNGLTFPGDPGGPPEETINCRCTTMPAEQEEED